MMWRLSEYQVSGVILLFWFFIAVYTLTVIPASMFAFMISVMVASLIINSIFKVLVKKERPSEIDEYSARFYIGMQKFSFPSCHTQLGFTAVALLEKFYPPLFLIALLLAIVTSVARLAIGRHWRSDVIGGAIVGYAVGRIYIYLLI